MSQDVKISKDAEGIFDLVPNGNDFEAVDGLETAVLTSLFTDSRTESNEVPEAYRRKGWVGNILTLSENYELGGELWLLDQARINQNTINRGQNFAYNSLVWMINNGLADSIEVEILQERTRGIYIKIELFKAFNLVARYITLWKNTGPIG